MPRYRVFKDGKLVEEPTDIRKYWSDDLVTFVLGCSFSFELPILQAGIRLRHIERDTVVPMYRTSIDCVPAGRFKGKMVVSMRPFTPADAIRAVQITSRFPAVHGAPVHHRPARGDRHRATSTSPTSAIPPRSATGELPVFWACGVTPQVAIEAGPTLHLHHPQAGLDADHRQEERLAGSALTVIPEFRASEISGTQGSQPCDRGAPGSRLSALARSGRDDRCPYSRPINQP